MLSIWSAGCSSGEEPYTLSIYLKEYFGPQASQWDTRILATDISQQAMAKAKAAVYQPPADMPSRTGCGAILSPAKQPPVNTRWRPPSGTT
ncbi:MAG: CheR family methyltransferase [Dysosmobacter sp.]